MFCECLFKTYGAQLTNETFDCDLDVRIKRISFQNNRKAEKSVLIDI